MASSEYEMDNDKTQVWGSIAAGVLIGVVVGGSLALLFAPKSGSETRADLGKAVDDLQDRAEKVIDDLQVSASDLVSRSKAVLDQTRENIVRSVEVGKDAYAQKKEELTSQLDSPSS
jgi:gas vesicle protein